MKRSLPNLTRKRLTIKKNFVYEIVNAEEDSVN